MMKAFIIFLFLLVNISCSFYSEQVEKKPLVQKKYYPNQQLMEYREYRNGMKNGIQISYWDNGNKRFEYIAKNDAYEGELREWDYNGKLFHLGHYMNGQEEGVQKLWYENGKIRSNYVIHDGRRFGLLGTKNCKNVSDSIFLTK